MRVSSFAPQQAPAVSISFVPQAHQWVQLRDCLSEFSDDRALLLCQETEDRWVAWVPDYGEAILTRDQILKP
jgi:hypothetical protein